jgi:carbon storage regulator
MLVLSRQRDETIMIGDDIEITVVDIRGDKVRLGINAPTRVAVHRKEVYEAIKRENEQASRLPGADLGAVSALGAVRPGISAASRPLPLKAAALTGGKLSPTSEPPSASPPANLGASPARAGPSAANPPASRAAGA